MNLNSILSRQDSSGLLRKCCTREHKIKGGKVTMKDTQLEMAEGNKTHLGKTMRSSIDKDAPGQKSVISKVSSSVNKNAMTEETCSYHNI